MLFLITGANGAGKTLNTLKWVQKRALEEGRPVCHNGRFEPVPGGELANWKTIEMKDWQAEPDGTIFLVDECHNDFPLRSPSSVPPDFVKMLAEHRRRGFDFYLVTQHPQNIDVFVRRLIGSPGWHRHLKRTFGGDLVSVSEWAAVNTNCEKPGAGKSGTVTMQAFPKEVYGWYKSASLHTGKKKIPKQVWFLAFASILIPLMLYFAFTRIYNNTQKNVLPAKTETSVPGALERPGAQNASVQVAKFITADEYIDQRKPRLPDFPQTAPVYDKTTEPVTAPYPAACISMGKTCKCYTQQATLLQVSGAVCLQIVQQGFFMDWEDKRRPENQARPVLVNGPHEVQRKPESAQVPQIPPARPPMDFPEPQPGQITQAQLSAALAMRNPAYVGRVARSD